MLTINTCKQGVYLGLGIAASPLILGVALTTKNVIHSLVMGLFMSTMTAGAYTTAFNAIFFSPNIWILTFYTSCIGLPIVAISLLAMGILYCAQRYA